MQIKKRTPVKCKTCGKEYTYRVDALPHWKGNCKRCSNIEVANRPEIKEKKSRSARIQVLRQGGIPNAKKFNSDNNGENHWHWRGGITSLNLRIRHCQKAFDWRDKIFKRDNYICQLCGQRGNKLNADHYPETFANIIKKNKIKIYKDAIGCEELWDLNNGRTLCKDCHRKSHMKKNKYRLVV